MTGAEFVPARRPDLVSVELDGETVVYADGQIHKLDRVASVVWNAFDGATTVGELADDLAAVYGEDRETVLSDLLACIADMQRQQLLVPPDAPA